jgi:2-haloacid dehalogenase
MLVLHQQVIQRFEVVSKHDRFYRASARESHLRGCENLPASAPVEICHVFCSGGLDIILKPDKERGDCMKKLIVFDVNETMLDMGVLDPLFEKAFGRASIRTLWFATVLRNSLVSTITGQYDDFAKIAAASLDMTARQNGLVLNDEHRSSILGAIRSLPAYRDVIPGLEKLKSAGFRLFTLTNSPLHVVDAQLKNAGLAHYFEKSFSVDSVRMFKPAAEVYRMTASELGVSTEHIRLVAAHDWDVVGALNAGCAAAFVARPGKVLNPLLLPPDIIGLDLFDVAEKIVQVDS